MPGNEAPTQVAIQTQYQNSFPFWEYPLLKAWGAPTGDVQLQALNIWARSEGMPAAANNWLAITSDQSLGYNYFGQTGDAPGLTGEVAPGKWNRFGAGGTESVLTFATAAAGIAATTDFMNHGYSGILKAFRDPNATLSSIGDAIMASGTWYSDGANIKAADGKTTNPLTGRPTMPVYTGGAQTGDSASSSSSSPGGSSSFTNCNSQNCLIGEHVGIFFGHGPSFCFLNPCQGKAIMGGLTVAVGVFVMTGGIVLMATGAVKSFGLKELTKPLSKLLGGAQRGVLGKKGGAPAVAKPKPTPAQTKARLDRDWPAFGEEDYGDEMFRQHQADTAARRMRERNMRGRAA